MPPLRDFQRGLLAASKLGSDLEELVTQFWLGLTVGYRVGTVYAQETKESMEIAEGLAKVASSQHPLTSKMKQKT